MKTELNTAQRYALLLSRFERLKETFERLVVDRYATCEARDKWRIEAGLEPKCEDDDEE